jgi:hypothetical protein
MNKNGAVVVTQVEPVAPATILEARIQEGWLRYFALKESGESFQAGCVKRVIGKYAEALRVELAETGEQGHEMWLRRARSIQGER